MRPLMKHKEWNSMEQIKPGDYIFISGYAGLEGTFEILKRQEERLKAHYTSSFLREIQKKAETLHLPKQKEVASYFQAAYIKELSEGGIYQALYKMAMSQKVGFDIDIFKIPILQETIELCELFRINPYQFNSGGSYLIIANPQKEEIKHLIEEDGFLQLIGLITESPDKLIRSGDEVKHLQRPVLNEIEKIK